MLGPSADWWSDHSLAVSARMRERASTYKYKLGEEYNRNGSQALAGEYSEWKMSFGDLVKSNWVPSDESDIIYQ